MKKTISWSPAADSAARAVYERMKVKGIPADYNGAMNLSTVILFALNQTARLPLDPPADRASDPAAQTH